MRFVFGTLLSLCFATPAIAAPISIAVDAGSRSEALTRALSLEIGDVEFTRAGLARVRVVVRRVADTFLVRVSTVDATLAERRVPSGQPEQALRVATLLTTRAVATVRALDEPFELPPAPRTFGVHLTTDVLTTLWWRPRQPQLGLELGVGVDIGRASLAVVGGAVGHVCCRRESTGIAGDAEALALGLDGAWTFAQWTVVRVRGAVRVGAQRVTAEAEPLTFADLAPTQRVVAWEALVRVGGALELEVWRDRLFFRAAAGAQLRVPSVQVAVPPGYSGAGWVSGPVVPFATVGVQVALY
ncbi:MAG: hypothetical protein RKU31_22245 [Deltaproteobacteria bacterium]